MSAQPETILAVRDLTVQIDTLGGVVQPLDRVSFDLRTGETFALVGESGCGKSMTAFSLMRLLPPGGRIAGGEVRLGETELCTLTEAEMRKVRGGQMAMIFQEPGTSLNPVFTVAQQVTEVLTLHRGLDARTAREEALALLKQVGIPDPDRRLDEYPFQFSGGMNQRVMIAMALAGRPRLLIADEPTTALDVTIQAQVLDLLAGLQRDRGMAMMLITHDLGVVAKMAHRIGVMYAGQLIEEAPRERFFRAPAHPYSQKLFESLPGARADGGRLATISGNVPPMTTKFVGCRFAARCPAAFDRCRVDAPGWYPLAEGHRVRCHLYDPAEADRGHGPAAAAETVATPREQIERAEPLLEVRDLKMHFPIRRGVFQRVVGHVRAVDGVNLAVHAGRTLALVGESGCGKTTVGKAILRLLEPTAGTVRLDGTEVTAQRGAALRAVRAQMQMVFQDPFGSLNPRLRVAELIEEGMIALGIGGDAGKRQTRLTALMSQVGLSPEMADRYPHEFSGGQRQRIAIARALAVSPKLIICDEPTSALDVSVQAQILNLLEDLQRELGLSLLFITHNLAVVEHLAHDVAVMYLGRIVEYGTTREVLHNPQHPYTKALLAAVPKPTAEAGESPSTPPVRGDIPSPSRPPSGCHFHPRCPVAIDACKVSYPGVTELGGGHTVRCHLANRG